MAANDTRLVTGNTYPVRAQLAALGGTWDAAAKGWRVPVAKYDEAVKLTQSAPVSPKPTGSARRSNWYPCGYPGCSPTYCDECDGKGGGHRGRY